MISRNVMKLIVAVALIFLVLVGLQVRSWTQARERAAQGKVDRGQAGAFRESVKDADNAQADVHGNDMATGTLDRTNAEEIRNAKGADAVVDPAARDAGLRALCRRPAYRNNERCRVLNAGPAGVAPAR